jgi:hypothetical protein
LSLGSSTADFKLMLRGGPPSVDRMSVDVRGGPLS